MEATDGPTAAVAAATAAERQRTTSRTGSRQDSLVGAEVTEIMTMDNGFTKGFNLLNYEDTVKQLDIYYGIGTLLYKNILN